MTEIFTLDSFKHHSHGTLVATDHHSAPSPSLFIAILLNLDVASDDLGGGPAAALATLASLATPSATTAAPSPAPASAAPEPEPAELALVELVALLRLGSLGGQNRGSGRRGGGGGHAGGLSSLLLEGDSALAAKLTAELAAALATAAPTLPPAAPAAPAAPATTTAPAAATEELALDELLLVLLLVEVEVVGHALSELALAAQLGQLRELQALAAQLGQAEARQAQPPGLVDGGDGDLALLDDLDASFGVRDTVGDGAGKVSIVWQYYGRLTRSQQSPQR
jgi:hypothetical protein